MAPVFGRGVLAGVVSFTLACGDSAPPDRREDAGARDGVRDAGATTDEARCATWCDHQLDCMLVAHEAELLMYGEAPQCEWTDPSGFLSSCMSVCTEALAVEAEGSDPSACLDCQLRRPWCANAKSQLSDQCDGCEGAVEIEFRKLDFEHRKHYSCWFGDASLPRAECRSVLGYGGPVSIAVAPGTIENIEYEGLATVTATAPLVVALLPGAAARRLWLELPVELGLSPDDTLSIRALVWTGGMGRRGFELVVWSAGALVFAGWSSPDIRAPELLELSLSYEPSICASTTGDDVPDVCGHRILQDLVVRSATDMSILAEVNAGRMQTVGPYRVVNGASFAMIDIVCSDFWPTFSAGYVY